jgi:2-hydroxychromene-2-carboxylate isomerase
VDRPAARFYFDLASPLAYLAAERVLQVLPGPCEWQPVLSRELDRGEDCRSGGGEQLSEEFRREIARLVEQQGLQRLRWPEPFPCDSALAMRVATYAKSIGRTVPFAQAAFRQAFAGGRDLGQLDNVLIAAAACEMHPSAIVRGAELRSVAEQLSAASEQAARAGVVEVPAITVGERIFHGEDAVEQAAERMLAPAVER